MNVATTTPSSSGYYALTVPGGFPAGTYLNLKVIYSGDTNYSALSTMMGTLTVTNDVLAREQCFEPNSGRAAIFAECRRADQFWQHGCSHGYVNADRRDNHALLAQPRFGHRQQFGLLHTFGSQRRPGVGHNSLKVAYSGDTNYSAATVNLTITGVATLSTSVISSYSTGHDGWPAVHGQFAH